MTEVEHWDDNADGPLSETTLRAKLEALGYSVTRYSYPPGTYFPDHTHNIDKIEGVYVNGVRADGAAKEAGIKAGDVILSIDDVRLNSGAALQEQVSKYRPGEKVKVVVRRGGSLKQFDVVLRNLEGNTEIVKQHDDV